MLMISLILFGWVGFQRMGVSQLPDIDFPVVNISVTLNGAAPEVMELSVVDPIESALMSIQGIIGVSSTARSGLANITVEFDLDKNIDIAVQEIQTKITQAQRELPKDVDPPIVMKTNPEDQPIMWMAVSSPDMPLPQLMSFVRDRLRDRFATVPGVADVFLGGYVEPNLRVWVSQKKLNQHALAVSDVINTIQMEHAEPPAGRIDVANKEFNIRTMGEAESADEFSRLMIQKRGGLPNYTPMALDQVATIEEGLADVRRRSRVMGAPAVGMGIRKQRGVNAVQVAENVRARMQEISKTLPPNVKLGVNFDSTRFIKESIHELNFTLVLSAVLTALVCWVFLGSWSATMNVILAIPTSILGTFIVLKYLNFTLNTFTLLGLSLAIGIVVDDAIMVLENIVRHREDGKGKMQAASDGAREITFAALAATAAIIAIFLPIAFMSGIVGKFFYQFGVTISVAVALSLLEALTLTPMRTSQFLEIGERTSRLGKFVEDGFHRLAQIYTRILPTLLARKWTTVLVALGLFAGSLALIPFLKKEFVPSQDMSTLLMRLKTDEGSSFDFTDGKTREVEDMVAKLPEAERYFAAIGGFGGGEVNTAMLFVTLKAKEQRPRDEKLGRARTQQEIAAALRTDLKQIKGVSAFIMDLSQGGFSGSRGFPIEFALQGERWDVLIDSTKKVLAEMEKTGLMSDIDSDYRGNVEEYHVVPDRERARLRGVSVADVGQAVSALMGGAVAGKFSRGGHRFDIRVKMAPDEQQKIQDLNTVMVRNNRGELIPLGQVIKIERVPGLQSISRKDRERAISIFANVATGKSQAAALEAIDRITKQVLPAGYRMNVSGSAKTFKESGMAAVMALVMGLIISYMVLASQFNSFIHPVTVLMALPFGISGALIALFPGGHSLNMYSVIGIILLMGIVKKNSILLVDFTNHMREQGMNIRDALIHACPMRLRPILMTSIATTVGAIPPALAIGPGAETRVPMALAVIGGVVVSTFLTLLVVPSFYMIVSREKKTHAEKLAESEREAARNGNGAHAHAKPGLTPVNGSQAAPAVPDLSDTRGKPRSTTRT